MKWKTELLFNGVKFPQEPTVEGNIYSGTIYLCEILESQLGTSGNSFLCLRNLTCYWSQTLFSQCLVLQIKHPLFFFLNWKMSVNKVKYDPTAVRHQGLPPLPGGDKVTPKPGCPLSLPLKVPELEKRRVLGSALVWNLFWHSQPSATPGAAGGAQPSQGSFSAPPRGTHRAEKLREVSSPNSLKLLLETANNVGTSIPEKQPHWKEAHHYPASGLLALHDPSVALGILTNCCGAAGEHIYPQGETWNDKTASPGQRDHYRITH